MLWFDLIDIAFFIAGVCVGGLVIAMAAVSGYTSKCDDCDIRRCDNGRE